MASYHPFLQHPRAPFESPAKVFAKLKSRVQRAMDEAPDIDTEYGAAEVLGGMLCTPKRRAESQHLCQDQRFGDGEVTAVTLSPISSPQKSNNYRPEDELSRFMEMGHVFKQRGVYVPRERAFLESTTVSNAATHKPVQHTDRLCARAESADRMVHCEPGLLEEDAGVPPLSSPTSGFSPMKKRLRKRKWDEQELSKVNSKLSDVGYVHCQAKEKKISPALSEDDYITSTEDVEACSQPEELRVAPAHTGCAVETPPPNRMNPTKMFAYLKERENQRDLCDNAQKVTSSTRTQASWDNRSEATARPDSAASSVDRLEGLDSEDSKEFTPEPGPAPVLLEDPLMLNSPCFIIPKTEAVFKRAKLPQYTFPSENVVHLRKWFIRKSRKGLFVDGINRENNIPWNSNIITDRVSNTVLKTVSGRVYILVGKMDLDASPQFPKWFLKSFTNGFPSNWKELYEKYLAKENLNEGSATQREKMSQKSKSSMSLPVKQQRQKSLKTPQSYPSATGANATVSRSGRLIKPPLEYWKGGRVILDAHMNVTIHECYDTSIIRPEITATVSTKPSVSTKPAKKPAVVMVPVNDVCEQRESIPKSQPLRKVKVPLRRRHPAKADIVENPLSPKNSSPTERVTRSRLNHLATEKTKEETVPHVSKNPKKKAMKQRKDIDGKIVKGSQHSVSSQWSESSVSPPVTLSSPPPPSTHREKALKKKREKPTDKESQMNLRCRSSLTSSSSDSSDRQKSQKELSKDLKTQVRPKRRNKTTPPSKPSRKTSQPNTTQAATRPNRTLKGATSKTHISQQQDEDEWTEEELKRLHEAVSCYPKHIAGYWTKVAKMVGTRSAEECHKQHTSMGTSKTPTKQDRKTKKKSPPKDKDLAVISARVGTLRRKQQVREFLEAMPKDNMDDVFSSAYMQSKRFEVPSMCASDDHDFTLSDLEPLTPRSTGLPEAKTPQCLHITPGMMGSTNRNCDDKYVFHLQKRMKNNQYQFNVQKHAPKSFTPTASVKKTMRRCANTENDTFVVWQMFPEKDEAQADSGEEEDFYFSEND